MKDPDTISDTDYLVMESTYGNRIHSNAPPIDHLRQTIITTAKRGGSVIIPAFAVGRAQILLYYIEQLKKRQHIPDIPVFLDSPMAVNATKLLAQHMDDHRLDKESCYAACNIATYVNTPEDSRTIDTYHMPMIIISASGMATGGRVLHHLKAFAPDERNTILFTGYQAGGTRGARILNGERSVKIHGNNVNIRAQVDIIDTLSAHADAKEILAWLENFKTPPKMVFITHGEYQASIELKQRIEDHLHWQCIIPDYLQKVTL